MKFELKKFIAEWLQECLKIRLRHPVTAMLLVFLCSSISAFDVPCSAACMSAATNLTGSSTDMADMTAMTAMTTMMGDCCSSELNHMSCCEKATPVQDLLAASVMVAELSGFALIPPTNVSTTPSISLKNSGAHSAWADACSNLVTLTSCKIYIVNRQLLI